MVRGVRFRLIYLYLLQVRDAERDDAAWFTKVFSLHRDMREMLIRNIQKHRATIILHLVIICQLRVELRIT